MVPGGDPVAAGDSGPLPGDDGSRARLDVIRKAALEAEETLTRRMQERKQRNAEDGGDTDDSEESSDSSGQDEPGETSTNPDILRLLRDGRTAARQARKDAVQRAKNGASSTIGLVERWVIDVENDTKIRQFVWATLTPTMRAIKGAVFNWADECAKNIAGPRRTSDAHMLLVTVRYDYRSASALHEANTSLMTSMRRSEIVKWVFEDPEKRVPRILFPGGIQTPEHELVRDYQQSEATWAPGMILEQAGAQLYLFGGRNAFVPKGWTYALSTDLKAHPPYPWTPQPDARVFLALFVGSNHWALAQLCVHEGPAVHMYVWDDLQFGSTEPALLGGLADRRTLIHRLVTTMLGNKSGWTVGVFGKDLVPTNDVRIHFVRYSATQNDGWSCGYRVIANLLRLIVHWEDKTEPRTDDSLNATHRTAEASSHYYKALTLRVAWWFSVLNHSVELDVMKTRAELAPLEKMGQTRVVQPDEA